MSEILDSANLTKQFTSEWGFKFLPPDLNYLVPQGGNYGEHSDKILYIAYLQSFLRT